MTRRPFAALVAASLCAVFVLAACSAVAGGPNTSPSPAAGAGATVSVASSSAGDHLAGPNGRALYFFASDSANTSTCTGGCATAWPPLTVAAGQTPQAAAGLAVQLATITRSDGSLQVTANGLPLYYFVGDKTAADITGQGQEGFSLAGADGKALSGAAASAAPYATPKSTDNGGYY